MRVLIPLVSLLVATAAQCEPAEQPYARYLIQKRSDFGSIANALELDSNDLPSAMQMAGSFILLGPCRGVVLDAELKSKAAPSLSSFENSGPKEKLANAAKLMALSVMVESLGRIPKQNACRLAGELAFPSPPPDSDWRYCYQGLVDGVAICRRHSED